MDSQMSSTAAALREGIATSQKQAWTQRQADAQHREALRAEAVAYAERSDTRGRELAEARQRLKDLEQATERRVAEMQQELRLANQAEEREHSALMRQEGYYVDQQRTAATATQSLQGELDRLMQQRQLLSQELTDARQQHAKATNAAQQEKLQHQHQMAKHQHDADAALGKLKLELQSELHQASAQFDAQKLSAEKLRLQLEAENQQANRTIADTQAALEESLRSHSLERADREKLEMRLREALGHTKQLRNLFQTAQSDWEHKFAVERDTALVVADQQRELREQLQAARATEIALRAEEHTLQIECEASRAEVEHAVRAAAEAADAASEQHAETLELYATREEAERSREAARSAGKAAFLAKARRITSDKFGLARSQTNKCRQAVAAALSDHWQRLQTDVSNAIVARDVANRRNRAALQSKISELEIELASANAALDEAHTDLDTAQAKWGAELETALAAAAMRTQLALEEREALAAADLDAVTDRCSAEEAELEAQLNARHAEDQAELLQLQVEIVHVKNLADDREAQALLAEATEAAEALHVAEAKWSAMTKASLAKLQTEILDLNNENRVQQRKLILELEDARHSAEAADARSARKLQDMEADSKDNQARTEKALERLKAELVETEGMAQKEAAARRQAEQLASSLKTDQAEIVQAAQKRASQLEATLQAEAQQLANLEASFASTAQKARESATRQREVLQSNHTALIQEAGEVEALRSALSQARANEVNEFAALSRTHEDQMRSVADEWTSARTQLATEFSAQQVSEKQLSSRLAQAEDVIAKTKQDLEQLKAVCANEANVNQQLQVAYDEQASSFQAKMDEARGMMKASLTRVAEQVSTELRSGFDRERESLQTQHAAALEKLRETLSAQQYVGLSRSEAQTAEAVAQAANLKIQLDAENKSYADRVRVLEQGLAAQHASAADEIMALKQQCMHLKENEVESSKLVAEKLSRQLGELRAEGFRLREQLEQESAAADFAVRAERTTMSTEMRHQQELFAAAKAEAQRAKEECLRLRGRLADQSSANATEVQSAIQSATNAVALAKLESDESSKRLAELESSESIALAKYRLEGRQAVDAVESQARSERQAAAGKILELQQEHAKLQRQVDLAQQRSAIAETQAQDEARACSARLELQAQHHAQEMAVTEQRSKFELRQAQVEASDATSSLNSLEQLHASVVAGAAEERRSAVLAATAQIKREAQTETQTAVAAEIAAAVSTANMTNTKSLLDLQKQKEQAEKALVQAAAAHAAERAVLEGRAAAAAAAADQANQERSREASALAATKKALQISERNNVKTRARLASSAGQQDAASASADLSLQRELQAALQDSNRAKQDAALAEVAADAARAEVKQLRESLLMAKRDAAAAALKLEAAEKGAVDRLEDVRLIAQLSRVERGHLKGQLLEQAQATMTATAQAVGGASQNGSASGGLSSSVALGKVPSPHRSLAAVAVPRSRNGAPGHPSSVAVDDSTAASSTVADSEIRQRLQSVREQLAKESCFRGRCVWSRFLYLLCCPFEICS
eukprot:INCI8239.2.p1 GENE.INCI8239.2~~INCI8239.2.p1  ORF type:complete len:1742 (+),score=438.47 INCI8239.2:635-5227(+)